MYPSPSQVEQVMVDVDVVDPSPWQWEQVSSVFIVPNPLQYEQFLSHIAKKVKFKSIEKVSPAW